MVHIAKIRLLQARRQYDRLYSYLIPEEATVNIGCVAAVPFGNANRPSFGVVVELEEVETIEEELKELFYVLEEPYRLDEAIVNLCLYFSEHLLCTAGELFKAALPVGLTFHVREFLVLNEGAPKLPNDNDTDGIQNLFLLLQNGAHVERTGKNAIAADYLLRHKIARKAYLPEAYSNKKFVRMVTLNCDPEKLDKSAFKGLTLQKIPEYTAFLKYLKSLPVDAVAEKELIDRFSFSPSVFKSLEKRGLIKIEARPVYRGAYAEESAISLPKNLNEEQFSAVERLTALIDENRGCAALLHGVTGSGKTRVMLHLVRHTLAQGKGILFLVPEIGLTSNIAKQLLTHFPGQVTVLHSGLSAGERHDAWAALKNGTKTIVLGTRSAIFAPVKNLGLILMDEEQDQSYNADNAPRYHARDLARYRAAHEAALLLLASATPDIETYLKAKNGTYHLCKLTHRATGHALPSVTIVDLKEDLKKHPDRLIGNELQKAIERVLSRGEQCLLFMNRRGYQYAPFCPSCGHVITCPNCSVALTLHSNRTRYACCHYCGYTTNPPSVCPSCGAEHLFFRGYGTQRLEEETRELFPQARILRMDADTMRQKFSHDDLIQDFTEHKADILLGTQMIAKGHDFPDVTLVGVVMADTSLYLGDFRAGEETFTLLTQVIGRAGRAKGGGTAIIQTLNPDHEIFSLAATQDYENFYAGEIALRKAVLYPPFCHLSVFTLTGADEKVLNQAALAFNHQISVALGVYPGVHIIVYGPIEPAILRINNQYRRKFVIKHQNDRDTRALFSRLFNWFRTTQNPSLSLYYDLTPTQI